VIADRKKTMMVEEMNENPYRRHDRSLLCTVDEVAQLLSIGRTTAFELVRSGRLRSVKIGARRLIPRTMVEAFVDDLLEAS
jgi:excisionase family DNA binding protein